MSVVPPDHLSFAHAAGPVRKSGRAVEGDRGHTIWEWQTATGIFQRDVTDEQLRRLEASHLRIVEFSRDRSEHDLWRTLATGRMRALESSKARARTRSTLRGLWERLRG